MSTKRAVIIFWCREWLISNYISSQPWRKCLHIYESAPAAPLFTFWSEKYTWKKRRDIWQVHLEELTANVSIWVLPFSLCLIQQKTLGPKPDEIWCCHQWYFPLIFHIFVLLEWSVGEKDSSDQRFQSIKMFTYYVSQFWGFPDPPSKVPQPLLLTYEPVGEPD